MIYPQKNRLIRWFFHHYIINLVKRSHQQVNVNAITIDSAKSVLLLANHFSWWDGFILYYVNQLVFKKQFHVMVIEETVQRVSFLKYMGAFSVNKSSKDILTSINYAAGLLNDPENLVLIFPQGKLYSNFVDTVIFEKGLLKIMQGAKGAFQTVFAATFVESREHKKPSVSVYLAKAEQAGYQTIAHVEQAYQQHYNSSKLLQTQIVI